MSPRPPPKRSSADGSAAARTTDTRLAELVVTGALAVVRQHLVRAGDLLEAAFRLGVAGVRVGVQFAGALAVCLLDLVGGRRA